MKKLLLAIFLLTTAKVFSQQYNNEWINYSRTYYKFKVGATGLFRISQPSLAGLGIGSVPAEQFQLWRNGKEIPLYTSVQTGPMSAGDYIEFWGEMNDGKPDSILYRVGDFQLDNKWSLETDTAAFFLTVNPAGNNLRLVPTVNVLPSALPVEPYFMYTVGNYYKERLNPGYAQIVGEYIYSSAYDQGEGFTSFDVGAGLTKESSFPYMYPDLDISAPAPSIIVNAAGNQPLNPRQFSVKVYGRQVLLQTMDFMDYVKTNTPLLLSDLSHGDAVVDVTNNCPVSNDRMVISKIEINYARQFNFGGYANFYFQLPANAAGNYLEISNFNHGGTAPVLYDLTNGKRYVCDITNPALVKVALLASATARNLVLVSENAGNPVAVTGIQQKNFTNYALAANQGNYLIISHPALNSGTAGSTPVDNYKAYRSSAAGGSYNVKTYWIDDLIDQFAFGIKNNPLSIRNFVRWARNNFPATIKDVLLIGKGVNYMDYRSYESDSNLAKLSFVPTFGQPASDNLLMAEPGADEIPKIPVGRLAVISGDELTDYLNKVKQYEQQLVFQSPLISDKAWNKNVVHVVGSSDPTLGAILQAAMNNYTAKIRDTLYGGNVNLFSKVSPDPVQQATNERLINLFNQGISLLTYFGHSSSSTLEFNLDDPQNYNNVGKYPFFVVLGCNAGNFFSFNTLRLLTKETLSEKFVLAPQGGSIAYLASTHLGIVYYLDIYSTRLYQAMAVSQYGKTLGEIIKDAIVQTFNFTTQLDYYARLHCEQQTLHGDPALRLDISMSKPDYVIEDPLVKVSPSFISVAETHFHVDAKMMNLGKAIDKKIVVETRRTYPDNTTQVIRRDTIPGIRYIDSLSFDVPIVPIRDKGLNKISICVDADNAVDEIYETNNCITKDVFVYEDEARPVFPYNFSIVTNPNTKLVASTANPFVATKQYTLEIDTTELFNSAFKKTQTITSPGGVLEFTPGFAFTDSTVYYWRVAPVPTTGQPVWNKSSFIYLSNSGPNASQPGFNQSHFYQHTKSTYNRIILDSASRTLKFGSITNNLFVRMGTWISSGAVQEDALSVAINGVASIRLVCWFSSLVFNVINPVTFKPWVNYELVPPNFCSGGSSFGQGLYNSLSPNDCYGNYRLYNFEYRYADTSSRRKMMQLMKDSIPDGYYVVVRNFTLDPATFPGFPVAYAADWIRDTAIYGPGKSLYHSLKNAGFAGIDSFYRARPFCLIYKKNDASFIPKWTVGEGIYDNPTMSVDCPSPDTLGYITSPVFGPAKAWKQLKWRGSSEPPPGDVATVDVIGIKNDGSQTTLFSNLTTTQQDFDVSSIDATVYPYVQLKLTSLDTAHFTPYQLRYWRLTYTPVPEGAISPNIYFKTKDSVDVGEPIDMKIAFKNISDVSFDSLKVKFVITDRNNVPHIIPLLKRRPLPAGDTLQLGTLITTATLAGTNTWYIEANPDNDQPEQFHFNNFAFRNLYVKPDSLNPLLDVTFDGVHILNRDIVSSKPDIIIKLKDEAKWMILDDTSLLTLQIRFPNGSLRRYYFNNDTVHFTPAGPAPNLNNTASVDLRPYFTQDGEYELIVTGRDKSNNTAGAISYRVIFEVINKPMISNLLNYPNPFTTSTAFVFTVTGADVPQDIKIEIMTITGKIVREITKDELGPLHIGRNITDFKWDGTDMYGQKLANGIYLYRVVTNLNGKSLDKYTADGDHTDKFFTKGYGKMYLMR